MQFTTFDGDSEFEDNPFDPGPVDTEKEPNLYLPNLHNNWCRLWQQALKAGHLDIAQAIVPLMIYHAAAFADAICAVGSRVEKAFRSKTFNLCGKCKSKTHCLNHYLMGMGQHSQPDHQAQDIPWEALDDIKDDTYRAFVKVPDTSKPQKAFTSITQGGKEPSIQFIDRLQQALNKQVAHQEACDIILLKLTIENASSDCQKVLRPLKNLTIIEMVEDCNHIGTVEHKFKTMTAAFAAVKLIRSPAGQTCLSCEKLGHHIKDCHALKGPNPIKTPGVCSRCCKGQHYANQCRSKYDIEGKPISGNLNQSAGQHRAQTEILQPSSAAGMSPPYNQPPAAVPAWIWQPPAQ
ncbi:hypothetical protein HGM15179_019535 [Zosterops borbonicus]|uniref:CCHC-type domain-containing protein n=1 Tax=Zosterops borbonicus TaxID=364589 RepID=A0A8K1FY48_9PASS|nr:hypothetical protein HGM15179_019535 [Zosterops borbonicus]